MYTNKGVISSVKEVKKVEFFENSVCIRSNIVRATDFCSENPEDTFWSYDEVKVSLAEYMEMLEQRIRKLETLLNK